jgi:uncharacterized membrane protein (UPF0127 family)
MNPLRWLATALPATTVNPPPRVLQVRNVTRDTTLASQLEVAGSGATRRKGLLGRQILPAGAGLWIIPCESVHTFFMHFAIDLIYLDRGNRIRKVRPAVGPWRLSACLTAHSVLELPAGTIAASHTQPGDCVEFAPAEEVGAQVRTR